MEDIRDIKAQGTLPFEMDWWMWLGLAAGVALALLFFYRYFFKKKKKAAVSVSPVVPPHKRALQAIDALVQKAYPAAGQFKEYAFQLSFILRQYLEDRFNIPVTEKTTEEFLNDLAQQNTLTGEQKIKLKAFLMQSDMIKFAKQIPTVKECREAEKMARDLIQQTTNKDEL